MNIINKNFFISALKNVWRSKINILNIFLLSLSSAIIIFGFSYLKSITNLWDDWTNKSINFRILSVSFNHDEISTDKAIETLSNYSHVLEVTKSSGYIIGATIDDYKDEFNDGQIYLKGVTKNSVNIVKGKDLSDSHNEMICPIKFNPNSAIYSSDFSIDHSLDMNNSIGSTIQVRFAGSNTTEDMTIVGLYDSNFDYSAGNSCYATFETVKYLNEKYQPDTFDEEKLAQNGAYLPVYIIIDDIKNIDIVTSELENAGYYATSVTTINTEVGASILKVFTILAWLVSIIAFIILLLTNFNRINSRKKEFAIMNAIGYTSKDINSLLYRISNNKLSRYIIIYNYCHNLFNHFKKSFSH